jgi:hypothetical protein
VGQTGLSKSSSSSSIVTPVHGALIATVLEPGIYYLNAYVDERLTGTTLLFAETDRPRYSYMLMPEDLARVANGELLTLMRRARHTSGSAAGQSSGTKK